MQFEWDENKNQINRNKHSIDFEEVKQVFDDTGRKVSKDTKNDYGEERYILIGRIIRGIIVVVFTIRKSIIRIISARPANKKEREFYEQSNTGNNGKQQE